MSTLSPAGDWSPCMIGEVENSPRAVAARRARVLGVVGALEMSPGVMAGGLLLGAGAVPVGGCAAPGAGVEVTGGGVGACATRVGSGNGTKGSMGFTAPVVGSDGFEVSIGKVEGVVELRGLAGSSARTLGASSAAQRPRKPSVRVTLMTISPPARAVGTGRWSSSHGLQPVISLIISARPYRNFSKNGSEGSWGLFAR